MESDRKLADRVAEALPCECNTVRSEVEHEPTCPIHHWPAVIALCRELVEDALTITDEVSQHYLQNTNHQNMMKERIRRLAE